MRKIHTLDAVLWALLANPNQYVSGEKIAQELLITRSAVHKRVEKLRAQGYIIEGEERKGFLLKEPYPYHIIPEKIQSYLSLPNDIELLFIEKTNSTNTLAKEILKKKQKPFILCTRDQTSGRGRMDRSWKMSLDQDIAMSIVLPCHISQYLLFSIIRLASLAVWRTLNQYCSERCFIKWPNDVMTKDGKKICGILTESVLEDNEIRYIIVGIGVNINSTNLPDYAQSLRDLTNQEHDINKIYALLIDDFVDRWNKFPHNEESVFEEWERLLLWKGEKVSLLHGDTQYQGVFCEVLRDGSLILEINNEKRKFLSGDLSGIQLKKH